MRNISININLQFYRSIHCLVFVCLFVVFILINIFTFERLFLSTITFLKISEEIDYDQLMILALNYLRFTDISQNLHFIPYVLFLASIL